MKTDTKHFLDTLLFVADNPDNETREFQDATIYDFSPEFVGAVEAFIDGFRDHLAKQENELADRADDCERSFGGNVFFTLSGHGCGFWDDRDMELGDYLSEQLYAYSGNRYRFENLEYHIEIKDLGAMDGLIDLAFIPEAIDKRRAEIFATTPKQ